MLQTQQHIRSSWQHKEERPELAVSGKKDEPTAGKGEKVEEQRQSWKQKIPFGEWLSPAKGAALQV